MTIAEQLRYSEKNKKIEKTTGGSFKFCGFLKMSTLYQQIDIEIHNRYTNECKVS